MRGPSHSHSSLHHTHHFGVVSQHILVRNIVRDIIVQTLHSRKTLVSVSGCPQYGRYNTTYMYVHACKGANAHVRTCITEERIAACHMSFSRPISYSNRPIVCLNCTNDSSNLMPFHALNRACQKISGSTTFL